MLVPVNQRRRHFSDRLIRPVATQQRFPPKGATVSQRVGVGVGGSKKKEKFARLPRRKKTKKEAHVQQQAAFGKQAASSDWARARIHQRRAADGCSCKLARRGATRASEFSLIRLISSPGHCLMAVSLLDMNASDQLSGVCGRWACSLQRSLARSLAVSSLHINLYYSAPGPGRGFETRRAVTAKVTV